MIGPHLLPLLLLYGLMLPVTGMVPVLPDFTAQRFPGLGQFYNRQPVKGVAFLVAGGALMWLSIRDAPPLSAVLGATPTISPSLVVWTCLLLAVYAWSMIDASLGARTRP